MKNGDPLGIGDDEDDDEIRPPTPPKSNPLVINKAGEIVLGGSSEDEDEDVAAPARFPVPPVVTGEDTLYAKRSRPATQNVFAQASNRLLNDVNYSSAETCENRALLQEFVPKNVNVPTPDGGTTHVRNLQTQTKERRAADRRARRELKANEEYHRARETLKIANQTREHPYHEQASMPSTIATTQTPQRVGYTRKIYNNGLTGFFRDLHSPSVQTNVITEPSTSSATTSSNHALVEQVPQIDDLRNECLNILMSGLNGDNSFKPKARTLYTYLSGNFENDESKRTMFRIVISACDQCHRHGNTVRETMLALLELVS